MNDCIYFMWVKRNNDWVKEKKYGISPVEWIYLHKNSGHFICLITSVTRYRRKMTSKLLALRSFECRNLLMTGFVDSSSTCEGYWWEGARCISYIYLIWDAMRDFVPVQHFTKYEKHLQKWYFYKSCTLKPWQESTKYKGFILTLVDKFRLGCCLYLANQFFICMWSSVLK